jgi:hypothetical protein
LGFEQISFITLRSVTYNSFKNNTSGCKFSKPAISDEWRQFQPLCRPSINTFCSVQTKKIRAARCGGKLGNKGIGRVGAADSEGDGDGLPDTLLFIIIFGLTTIVGEELATPPAPPVAVDCAYVLKTDALSGTGDSKNLG